MSCISNCFPTYKQMMSCFCATKEYKKEVKALVEKGFDKVDQVRARILKALRNNRFRGEGSLQRPRA